MSGPKYVYTNISPRHSSCNWKKCLLLTFGLTVVLLGVVGVVIYVVVGESDTENSIMSSPNDSRLYRAISLPSKLRVTLISDTTTSISAAAVNVAVGYFGDYAEFPHGVAHFLEHLLCMGTEKYPGQNYADEVTSGAGGYITAYTDSEVTNYWFVVSSHLKQALDVLAQFFVRPLMTWDSIIRELSAVESEYAKGLTNDIWSSHQILRSTSSNLSAFNG